MARRSWMPRSHKSPLLQPIAWYVSLRDSWTSMELVAFQRALGFSLCLAPLLFLSAAPFGSLLVTMDNEANARAMSPAGILMAGDGVPCPRNWLNPFRSTWRRPKSRSCHWPCFCCCLPGFSHCFWARTALKEKEAARETAKLFSLVIRGSVEYRSFIVKSNSFGPSAWQNLSLFFYLFCD